MFGSIIRIAKKKINDNQTVYAFVMNDLFNPSSDEKLLRFFSTGDTYEKYNYIHGWRFQKSRISMKEHYLVGLEMMK